jgi:hypothetical protein
MVRNKTVKKNMLMNRRVKVKMIKLQKNGRCRKRAMAILISMNMDQIARTHTMMRSKQLVAWR